MSPEPSAAPVKRKLDECLGSTDAKRLNVASTPSSFSSSSSSSSHMELDTHSDNVHVFAAPHTTIPSSMTVPPRPTTPPLGMTLAHYDASTGGYTASVVASQDEVKSSICSGMTPIYRTPMERWGSCLL
ncbi:hypothetical protein VTP01DRAFT_3210 [Rhizomucor pusillus]|uniref:uncharacterized protein n=1 Tax=Rhizomucor pusillus TaxID=4840 RepID=UPI0037446577